MPVKCIQRDNARPRLSGERNQLEISDFKKTRAFIYKHNTELPAAQCQLNVNIQQDILWASNPSEWIILHLRYLVTPHQMQSCVNYCRNKSAPSPGECAKQNKKTEQRSSRHDVCAQMQNANAMCHFAFAFIDLLFGLCVAAIISALSVRKASSSLPSRFACARARCANEG
jgi:hypothetical protein